LSGSWDGRIAVERPNKELADAERSGFKKIPENKGDDRFSFSGRLLLPRDPDPQKNADKKPSKPSSK
jgi:hypothetical protein